MDENKLHDLASEIYWVVADRVKFIEDTSLRRRLNKEQKKIAMKYSELKSSNSFLDAEKTAVVEWIVEKLQDDINILT